MCYSLNFKAHAANPHMPTGNEEIHEILIEVDEFVHAQQYMLADLDEAAHAAYDHAMEDALRAAIAHALGRDIVYVPFQN